MKKFEEIKSERVFVFDQLYVCSNFSPLFSILFFSRSLALGSMPAISHTESKKLCNEAASLRVPLKQILKSKKLTQNDLPENFHELLETVPTPFCEKCDNEEDRNVGFWPLKKQWRCLTCHCKEVDYHICLICQEIIECDIICDGCDATICIFCWNAKWICLSCTEDGEENTLCEKCFDERKTCKCCEGKTLCDKCFDERKTCKCCEG